jgi:hypothetical protein
MSILRLDMPGRSNQPAWWRWLIGTVVAIGLSLVACTGLVAIATRLVPSTIGYGHFAFSDYSKLTILGVFVACVGWPFVIWITSRARRLYLWLGILAVVVSLAPDLWILHLGQPAAGVATLAVMHVALGVITYAAMVLIAPQRSPRSKPDHARA